MYTNKICRDNHIHYTSLRLLFSIIMHVHIDVDLFMLYPSVSVFNLHALSVMGKWKRKTEAESGNGKAENW